MLICHHFGNTASWCLHPFSNRLFGKAIDARVMCADACLHRLVSQDENEFLWQLVQSLLVEGCLGVQSGPVLSRPGKETMLAQ